MRQRLFLNGREVVMEELPSGRFKVRCNDPVYSGVLDKAPATLKFEELAQQVFEKGTVVTIHFGHGGGR